MGQWTCIDSKIVNQFALFSFEKSGISETSCDKTKVRVFP